MNPFAKSAGFLVSKTTASVDSAATSNSAGVNFLMPLFITESIDAYPFLFMATFIGKYAGGGNNPSNTASTNDSLFG